ncbi:MAG: hypothetical protein PW845_26180 [Pseudomonas sp.]|nr:hypothetical protein [Pseudomonas sp.]
MYAIKKGAQAADNFQQTLRVMQLMEDRPHPLERKKNHHPDLEQRAVKPVVHPVVLSYHRAKRSG